MVVMTTVLESNPALFFFTGWSQS